MANADTTRTKRPAVPKRQFKQSPADSLMEELDKKLDTQGFGGSPGQGLSKPPDRKKDPEAFKKWLREQMKRRDAA